MLDADEKPVANEDYKAELPDGTIQTGKTNGDGVVRFDPVQDGGVAAISFPNRDDGEWIYLRTEQAGAPPPPPPPSASAPPTGGPGGSLADALKQAGLQDLLNQSGASQPGGPGGFLADALKQAGLSDLLSPGGPPAARREVNGRVDGYA